MSYPLWQGADPAHNISQKSLALSIFDCHLRKYMGSEPHRFFPPFHLDRVNAQLRRGEERISLRRKTFEVLLYLVDHAGQLVTKAALLDAIWSEVTVSDSMPAICVAELRKALGDEAKIPRFIETVHGRGYRFVAKVTSSPPMVAARQPPVAVLGLKPIVVGREDELARLQSWYSHVLEGQRHVIFVTGEPGIGKTTFAQTFLDSIQQEGTARVGRGQCIEQYGGGEPYMPVLEALSRLGREPGGERVVEVLNRFAPTWLAQMPELLAPAERGRLQDQNQGVTQQRMLREMAQALEALAAEAPLVLLLEDLQWSDFSTLELISAIARRSEAARLLIVGTYRPVAFVADEHPLRTMKQELELHRNCEELRLKPLSEQDIAGYLAKRFSSNGSRQSDSLAATIHERTDGNPLFMINVVDYLVDAGLLESSHEARAAESAEILRMDRIEALRSVGQMIERNLERLKPEEQTVLEAASVVGPEFSAAAVAAALERPQNEVEACCARLSRREQFVTGQGSITWPDGTISACFRFHHAMYQEVLYGLLPPGRRVQLHRLIAVREEAGYGERTSEIATELAHHYSLGNDKNKAIHYLRLAGERAVARGAVVEAEGHYRRALELLSKLPQASERDRLELGLQMALGEVLWTSKSWSHPDANRTYTRALELAEKLEEATQTAMVLRALLLSALGRAQFTLARGLAERMLVAAERSRDRASLYAAHALLGDTLVMHGQYLEAQRNLELARRYHEESNSGELAWIEVDAEASAATAALLLGFPERARQQMREVLHRADALHDSYAVGLAHFWGGIFCGLIRDTQGALEHAETLRRLASRHPVWASFADLFTGEALTAQGNSLEGIDYLCKARAICEEMGHTKFLTLAKLGETEFLAGQGRIDEALNLVSDALSEAEGYARLKPPALRRRADLLAQSSADASEVDVAYRAAIDCARGQAAKYYELQASTSYARWLNSQGRSIEAQTLLAEIYGWFTEGFDIPALSEAKALLDDLNAKPNALRR
jgi:DNA-binding winged helix-turn-helix (wHTH) protein